MEVLALLLATASSVWICAAFAARAPRAAAVAGAALSLGSTLLLWRIHPSSFELTSLRALAVSIAELGALGVLAARLVRARDLSTALPILGGQALAVALLPPLRLSIGGDSGRFASTAMLLALGSCVFVGVLFRHNDRARAQALHDARTDQRLDIARELHDVVAHHVTGMVVETQAARLLETSDPDAALRKLEAIERAGHDAMTAMRGMVRGLRDDPDTLAPQPGYAELAGLVDTVPGPRPKVTLTLAEDLPPHLGPSVHRIVTEATTNARRHASGATRIDISVQQVDAAVEVVIVDDGATAAPSPRTGGYGIIGMRERVERLGGALSAGPVRHGSGWEVRALLPIHVDRTQTGS